MIIQVWYARISQKEFGIKYSGTKVKITEKSQDRIVNKYQNTRGLRYLTNLLTRTFKVSSECL